MDATDPLVIQVPPSNEEASDSQVGEPSLSQIMATIKSCHASLSTQIETIRVDIAQLKDDVHKIRNWVTTAKHRIPAIEHALTLLMVMVQEVAADHKSQESQLEDIEDRLRWNNLRFLGFTEGTERKQPEEFLISWLKQIFGAESFSNLFAIERAHCMLLRALLPGPFPRPMLAHFLYFRYKETILHKARNMQELLYHNNRITIFPKFSQFGVQGVQLIHSELEKILLEEDHSKLISRYYFTLLTSSSSMMERVEAQCRTDIPSLTKESWAEVIKSLLPSDFGQSQNDPV